MKEQQLMFKKDKDALKVANQQKSDEFTKLEDKLVSALFLVIPLWIFLTIYRKTKQLIWRIKERNWDKRCLRMRS